MECELLLLERCYRISHLYHRDYINLDDLLQQEQQQQNVQTSLHPPYSASAVGIGGNSGLQGPSLLPSALRLPHQSSPRTGVAMRPVSRETFVEMSKECWAGQGIQLDPIMLAIGEKSIDLYALHTEVLHFGGVANVSSSLPITNRISVLTSDRLQVKRHNLWNVITARRYVFYALTRLELARPRGFR